MGCCAGEIFPGASYAYPGLAGGFGGYGGLGGYGGYGYGSPCIVPFAGYSGGTCFENGELLIAVILLLCLCGGFGKFGGLFDKLPDGLLGGIGGSLQELT